MESRHNENRKEAIHLLIMNLEELAKINGKKYIYSSLKNESLINAYMDCGFVKGSSNTQEMMKRLLTPSRPKPSYRRPGVWQTN